MKCPHLITRSGACNDPALIEEPVTWCCNRADCTTKNEARPLHVSNLTSLARRGDREAWREYIDTVRSLEGERTAQQLRAAFAAAWSPA